MSKTKTPTERYVETMFDKPVALGLVTPVDVIKMTTAHQEAVTDGERNQVLTDWHALIDRRLDQARRGELFTWVGDNEARRILAESEDDE